ncbi:MAG: rhodanese-like domain-containing protein [Planctomycetota bacterium]
MRSSWIAIGAALALCAQALAEKPVRFVGNDEARTITETGAVIDTRGLTAYLAGHLPNAVHLPDAALRSADGRVPAGLHENEALASIFGRAGVSRDEPVLVYGPRDDVLGATLVAYTLARLGHDDVAVLESGYEAWAANMEVTRVYPDVEPAFFVVGSPTIASITLDEFEDTIGTDAHVFLDARPTAQYRGETGIWLTNGHIPGAHSLPWTTMMVPGNRSRPLSVDAMRERLAELDVSERDDIVVYCGTGREATLLTVLLASEMGFPKVRLYEGSWTEYHQTGGARIAVGDRVPPTTRVYRDGGFFLSGQPTEVTLEELAARGVTDVVSARTQREMDRLSFDEKEKAESLGMAFHHIPMGGDDDYSPEQVEALARIVAGAEGAVYVHCGSGGRARLLWMAHLVEREGVTPEEAMERSKKVGGEPWAFEKLLGGSLRYQRESD